MSHPWRSGFHLPGRRRLSAAAVAVFLAAAAYGVATASVASAGTSPQAEQPAANREEQLKRLVVMVRATFEGREEHGAGFVFGQGSDRLYVVTALHVVRSGLQEAERVEVLFRWLPGEWTEARLLDGDTALDVAVLAVADAGSLAVPELTWQTLARPDALAVGDRVSPIGYPGGLQWFVPQAPRFVSSAGGQFIQIEGDLVPGHSGGVLVTETWDVVGIVSRSGSVLGQASRIDRVLDRLAAWAYPVTVTFRETATTEEAAAAGGCEISGVVFDEDRNVPLSAVNLGLSAAGARGETLARTVATTGPDGRFGFACPPGLEAEAFPIRIQLWHPNWVAIHVTAVEVTHGDRRSDVNIPIRMSRVQLRQPPFEARPPIEPSSVGEVALIATRGQARSYDFRARRHGDGPTGGDFYFSGTYPGFWANNQGQRGVRDMGATNRPLDLVPLPASGFTQSGVNAVVGHVYVALARVEGVAIVFRVLDIGYVDERTQHYRIEYVVRRMAQ